MPGFMAICQARSRNAGQRRVRTLVERRSLVVACIHHAEATIGLMARSDIERPAMPDGHVFPDEYPGGQAHALAQPSSNRRQDHHSQHTFYPVSARANQM